MRYIVKKGMEIKEIYKNNFSEFSKLNIIIFILSIILGIYSFHLANNYYATNEKYLESLFGILSGFGLGFGFFTPRKILMTKHNLLYNKIIHGLTKFYEIVIGLIILLIFGVIIITAFNLPPALIDNPILVSNNYYMIIYNIVYVTLTASGIILGFALLGMIRIIETGPNINRHELPIYEKILSISECFIIVIASGLVLLIFSSSANTIILNIPTIYIKFFSLFGLLIFLFGGFYKILSAINIIRKTWCINKNNR